MIQVASGYFALIYRIFIETRLVILINSDLPNPLKITAVLDHIRYNSIVSFCLFLTITHRLLDIV